MSANGAISLRGTVDLVGQRSSAEIALSQMVDSVEVKRVEVRVPSSTLSAQDVPFVLSPTVEEVLWLHVFSPKKVILELTSNDATNPGPIRVGCKGHSVLSCSPGEGITAIGVINESTTEEVTVEISYAAVAADGDLPAYWDE